MDAKSQRVKERDRVLLVSNEAVEASNPTKEISSITPIPVKAAFGSVPILMMIRVFSLCPHGYRPPVYVYTGADDR